MIDFEAILDKQEEVRRRKRGIRRAWEKATDTSVKLSDMPRGGGDPDPMGQKVAGIADMEAVCKQAEEELAEMRKALRRKMRRLSIWQEKDMIRKVYLEGESIQRAAVEIGYEYRQAWRYLKSGRETINGLKMS